MRYDYQCQDCKRIFEVSASFEVLAALKPNCPDCNSKNVKRKYNPVDFILNGSGFYKKDSNPNARKD